MSVLTLTKDNFDDVVAKNDMLVVDYWASWCAPCMSFAPVFAEVAAQYPDVTFAKVNIEDETELAQDFNVRSIPLTMIFRQNVVVFSDSGVLPKSTLCDLIEQARQLDMKNVQAQLQQQVLQDENTQKD